MSRAKLLILEAEKKFEEGGFSGAKDAYRSSFLEEVPEPRELGNLGVVEDWEMLGFRVELHEKYSESKVVKAALANAYLRARRPQQALSILSELVGAESELSLRFPLQLVRLRAALAARVFDIAAVDFVELWMAAEQTPAVKRFRKGMLKEISGIVEPGAEVVLRAIENHLSRDSLLMEFVAAKRCELKSIAGLV